MREGKESGDARQAGFLRTWAIPLGKKQSCGMVSIGCHDLPVTEPRQERKRESHHEALAVIQVKVTVVCSSDSSGAWKWSGPGCILKVERPRFPEGLDAGFEKQGRIGDDS